MPFKSEKSEYHTRKRRKCKHCDNDALRNIMPDGRNKGFYRTCGSEECLRASDTDPVVKEKKRQCGKDNGRWLGDRRLVKRPMCTSEGKIWRVAVFERDDYTCQECGERGGRLQAHHIKSYYEHPESRFGVDNGQTLCADCHKKTATYGWKSINIRRQENVSV